MNKINFSKMVASGNDFVVINNSLQPSAFSFQLLARKLCNRKFGVGADGVLLVEKSKKADVKMRIFNADGSEAEMCGNGARCLALYSAREQRTENSDKSFGAGREQRKIKIETRAGIIEAKVEADNVKIKLTDPKDIKTDIPLRVSNRNIKVNFINTGVPHTVIFVEGLERIDVFDLGRAVRYHSKFKPAGTNVDFVQVLNNNSLAIRTYERGVEDETLACGTGAVAAAMISNIKEQIFPMKSRNPDSIGTNIKEKNNVGVCVKGGEILKVYFDKTGNKFYNVWLEGKVKIIYKGEYYV